MDNNKIAKPILFFFLPTNLSGQEIAGSGLIIMIAGAKNSSVTSTILVPRPELAKSGICHCLVHEGWFFF